MANIFDYLKWRGDLTFTQDPPNAVDALIFSSLSYISYGGRVEAEPLQLRVLGTHLVFVGGKPVYRWAVLVPESREVAE